MSPRVWQVRADDETVEAVRAGRTPPGDPVAAALAAWRADVDRDPQPRLHRGGPVHLPDPPPTTFPRGWEPWPDKLATYRHLTAVWDHIRAQTALMTRTLVRLNNLEVRMSDTTDAIVELNEETTALAARIDAALAGAVEQVDDATAAELRGVSARLKGLAVDAANPVPDPVPAPGEPLPPVDGQPA